MVGATVSPMSFPLHRLPGLLRRPRLAVAAAVSLVIFLGLSPWMQQSRAMLVAFDAGAALFLVLVGILMTKATPQTMERRARLQDENRWTSLAISLCVAAIVIGALSSELHAAKVKSLADIALATISIFLAWLFVAVMFAQQYAHSFYMTPGQLQFPGTTQPDYWDFTYFAVVLNMCFQTSDVVVSSGHMRRLVMMHSLVAFFFNVIIIAITVNVVAGVL